MRYMNLACLLMTLICLVTILIFSSGTNPNNNNNSAPVVAVASRQTFNGANNDQTGNRRSQLTSQPSQPIDESESLDSLNSQPLVSSSSGSSNLPTSAATTAAAATNGASSRQVAGSSLESFDDFNLFDDSRKETNNNKPLARRKLHELERESASEEQSTTTTNTLGQPGAANEAASTLAASNGADWPSGDKWSSSSPATAAAAAATTTTTTSTGKRQLQQGDISQALGSLIDPILNQVFSDMELGSLFRPLRRLSSSGATLSNGTGSHGPTMMMMLKPIIRRNKNGATIVISGSTSSSSSPFNESSLLMNESSLPSLIEKLLPPMLLRPITSMASATGSSPMMMMTMTMKPAGGSLGSSQGLSPLASLLEGSSSSSSGNGSLSTGNATSTNGLASATITFGSEPIIASASLPMAASTRLNPFGPLESLFSSRNSQQQHFGHHQHQQRPSLFMEPMGMSSMFRSPFGPMFMPPPPPMPPSPSLLSMIMRQAVGSPADSDSDDLPPFVMHRNSPFLPQTNSFTLMASDNNNNNKDATNPVQKNDTRQAGQQASQQQNSTISRQQLPTSSSSLLSSLLSANDSELDTMDSGSIPSGLAPLHSNARASSNFFYPRPSRPFGGSMVIFSPGNGGGSGLDTSGSMTSISGSRHLGPQFHMPPSFSPFGMDMGLPPISPLPPHMVLLSSNGDGVPISPPSGLLNPILRSILNNAMSSNGLSPLLAGEDRHGNRSGISGQAQVGKQAATSSGSSSSSSPRVGSASVSSPSWSMGHQHQPSQLASSSSSSSQIDPDDEWTTGVQQQQGDSSSNGIDRWDNEQTIQSKHLRARHREADSDLEQAGGFEATDFVTGLQMDQQQQQQLGGPSLMESIRQTIRGPGVTVERIIEVPSSGRNVAQVGPGVKSQSLSRVDYEDYESQQQQQQPVARHHHHQHHATGSSSLFGRPPMAEGRSDEMPSPPPPVGFIGRLLSDLTRGRNLLTEQPHPHQASPRTGRGRALLDEDLDEGDSGNESDELPSQDGPQTSRMETIQKQANAEQPRLQPRGMIPQQRSIQNQQQQHNAENPFTSPSSPLFGFPASTSPVASQQSSNNQATVATGNSNNSQAGNQNKPQQRSFTYHSNHELAAPFATANNKQQQADGPENSQAVEQEQSMGRARFLGPFAPASIVMGRRLDDQPSEFGGDLANGQINQASVESTVPTSMRNQAAFVPAAAIANANSNFRNTRL